MTLVYDIIIINDTAGYPDRAATKEDNQMKIYSVYDPEFAEFGKVLKGYDTAELVSAMNAIALPDEGVAYEPWIDSLEKCAIFGDFEKNISGGMPIELGMCWGHNKALNCLEYHRSSVLEEVAV